MVGMFVNEGLERIWKETLIAQFMRHLPGRNEEDNNFPS
jgi:alpha-mannosidase